MNLGTRGIGQRLQHRHPRAANRPISANKTRGVGFYHQETVADPKFVPSVRTLWNGSRLAVDRDESCGCFAHGTSNKENRNIPQTKIKFLP